MAQVPKVEEKPLSPFEITLLRKIDQIYNWQLQQNETQNEHLNNISKMLNIIKASLRKHHIGDDSDEGN